MKNDWKRKDIWSKPPTVQALKYKEKITSQFGKMKMDMNS